MKYKYTIISFVIFISIIISSYVISPIVREAYIIKAYVITCETMILEDKHEEKIEKYSKVIPTQCVFYDDYGPNVFVVKEVATVLGTTHIVEKVTIDILISNDEYIAIKSELVTENSQIVLNHKDMINGVEVYVVSH